MHMVPNERMQIFESFRNNKNRYMFYNYYPYLNFVTNLRRNFGDSNQVFYIVNIG